MADSEQARFCSYGLTKRHPSVSDVPVPIPVIPIPVIPFQWFQFQLFQLKKMAFQMRTLFLRAL
jgi:hypothetical protein